MIDTMNNTQLVERLLKIIAWLIGAGFTCIISMTTWYINGVNDFKNDTRNSINEVRKEVIEVKIDLKNHIKYTGNERSNN